MWRPPAVALVLFIESEWTETANRPMPITIKSNRQIIIWPHKWVTWSFGIEHCFDLHSMYWSKIMNLGRKQPQTDFHCKQSIINADLPSINRSAVFLFPPRPIPLFVIRMKRFCEHIGVTLQNQRTLTFYASWTLDAFLLRHSVDVNNPFYSVGNFRNFFSHWSSRFNEHRSPILFRHVQRKIAGTHIAYMHIFIFSLRRKS